MYQGVLQSDASACKSFCSTHTPGCHGYVYVDNVDENDPNMRGRCYLKFGNVHMNGTHSQQTTSSFYLVPGIK